MIINSEPVHEVTKAITWEEVFAMRHRISPEATKLAEDLWNECQPSRVYAIIQKAFDKIHSDADDRGFDAGWKAAREYCKEHVPANPL